MTMKEKQKAINQEIENFIDAQIPDYNLRGEWERLDYCSAWTQETERFIWLQSYNTIIAFIDKETGILYDILRFVYGYTATSAKHIAKFRHKFKYEIVTEFTWREV